MKYTVEYCKNNKVAIQVNSEEELKELYSYFLNYKHYEQYSRQNNCLIFDSAISSIDKQWFSYNKDYEVITFQQFMKNQTKRLKDFTDKDVIHCPTDELREKLADLLREQGFNYSTCLSSSMWKNYRQNTCYRPIQNQYSNISFYIEEGYTIHKAEDILALYEEKQMKQENIEQYYGKQFTNGKTVYTIEKFGVDSIKIVWDIDNLNKDWRIITNKVFFENLEKQIYTMLETQKIIGYSVPYDLAGGMVKKGTIYKKVQEDDRFYAPEGKISKTTLPKEIVETWEAVLEDEFKVGDFVTFDFEKAEIEEKLQTKHTFITEFWNKNKTLKIKNIEPNVHNIKFLIFEDCSNHISCFRKATQQEIDSLFTKTLTLSNGKKISINKGKIIPKGLGEVDFNRLKKLILCSSTLNDWDVTITDATFKIGCWENIRLIDIQNIIKEAERQNELMKD